MSGIHLLNAARRRFERPVFRSIISSDFQQRDVPILVLAKQSEHPIHLQHSTVVCIGFREQEPGMQEFSRCPSAPRPGRLFLSTRLGYSSVEFLSYPQKTPSSSLEMTPLIIVPVFGSFLTSFGGFRYWEIDKVLEVLWSSLKAQSEYSTKGSCSFDLHIPMQLALALQFSVFRSTF